MLAGVGLCAGVLEETVSVLLITGKYSRLVRPAIKPRASEVGRRFARRLAVVDAKSSTAFIQHGDKYLADIYQLARQMSGERWC